jgi:energy-coupling factor transporter ATP-binding protein EcfA2
VANSIDGGRVALAGYLYQILGVCGMQARVEGSGEVTPPDEISQVLELARNGTFGHEYLDQDGVLRTLGVDGGDEYVLLQFKYSQQNPIPSIGPTELISIVDRLQAGAQRTDRPVNGLVLITNRPLSDNARALHEAVSAGQGSSKAPTKQQRQGLSKLRVVTDIPLSRWTNDLKRFAGELGVLPSEVDLGINQLVGGVLRNTAGGQAWLTREDLLLAFTGYRQARLLTAAEIVQVNRKNRDRFDVAPKGTVINREVQNELAAAIEERALVFLHGHGGCGKTVILAQWANQLLRDSVGQLVALVELELAEDVSNTWICNVVSGWRNVPLTSQATGLDCVEEAIERIRVANPSAQTLVMHFGLDGIDEDLSREQEHNVRARVRWFWNEDRFRKFHSPRLVLVVTCRDAEIDDLTRWLRVDDIDWSVGNEIRRVRVTDFSPDELRSIAIRNTPDIFKSIEDWLGRTQHLTSIPETWSSDNTSPIPIAGNRSNEPTNTPSWSADPEAVASLHHPLIWRFFLRLEPADQLAFLRGDGQTNHRLGNEVVRWFCRKARARGLDISSDEIEGALVNIAHHTSNGGRHRFTRSDWIQPACVSNLMDQYQAKKLHRECLSAGLIVQENKQMDWRWRHQLVWSYLAGLEGYTDNGGTS